MKWKIRTYSEGRQKFICLFKEKKLLNSNNKDIMLKPSRNQIKWKQFTNKIYLYMMHTYGKNYSKNYYLVTFPFHL